MYLKALKFPSPWCLYGKKFLFVFFQSHLSFFTIIWVPVSNVLLFFESNNLRQEKNQKPGFVMTLIKLLFYSKDKE